MIPILSYEFIVIYAKNLPMVQDSTITNSASEFFTGGTENKNKVAM